MMNGTSAIRFREYEQAVERLKAIYGQLDTDEGRGEALSKIKVGLAREFDSALPGVRAVADAVAAAIKADMPRYLVGLIEKAQADVREAAAALRLAIDLDLETKFMNKAKRQ